ncbi:subclass B3 metallo-beta-lactamase [Dyella sp. 2HG41-7]|uniref:subclass B3 metallo-beta-lactamase n=1 Tax=Dyella sp. 2HG41-7 TaxID=2883239 RepID=UPI001EFF37FE|nr:subclass B3 metallo-beta-lactamase [Dyella sp. 2HG41-7]
MKRWVILCAAAITFPAVHAYTNVASKRADPSDMRATWTQPQKPFRIYGDTYYVGSRGLGAILIASPEGLVLIDSTLQENVPMIESNIRALGFRVQDIKLILNTHAHSDHAGGIAALAHDSGATVAVSAPSAKALALGGDDPDDPQHGLSGNYPKVTHVRIVADGEIVTMGSLALQMHAMPGHTPGSTGWTWRSCEEKQCLSIVYADSISLLSAPGYRYNDPAHPERLNDFRRTIATLKALPCDILLTPHPLDGFSEKVAHMAPGKPNPLIDTHACKAYATLGQRNLEERIAMEEHAQATH